ncbi:unnamed protein product [Brassicogethes aeneus]|uniref:Peptidyl-prolyl cis-trans isomerase n=1 Tax=Brassicogethes aeneus TaxID=1431903 RepID=A0A9P0FS67_BRAAE|nr:unnamed protein product [Brassicogethes aeneus]
MSVVIETTSGDITVDLFLGDRPQACLNFLKLCKIKYYNFNLFHTISRGFIAQTGDPTGSRKGGESIYGVLDGDSKRYFESEKEPRIKHTKIGLVSFVGNEEGMIGSQFFFTLGEDLTYLDGKHCVFGEVVEGFEVIEQINESICDKDDRPYQDIRITHTVVLDDPFPNIKRLVVPERSPSPSAERLQGGRIAPDEDIDENEGKSAKEVQEMRAEREAKARATILEMVGDLPDAEMAPPENVLFVCKLNPVTTDDDLEIIFSRFGKINTCEVIRDHKTGDSLQYAFVEFQEQSACEQAYFKMDNVLIDDRRIHVDFSQSVSKVKWLGKGRGVAHFNERGERSRNGDRNIGKGDYKDSTSRNRHNNDRNRRRSRSRDKKTSSNDYRHQKHKKHRSSSSEDDTKRKKRRNSSNDSSSEDRRKKNKSKRRNKRDSSSDSDKKHSKSKKSSKYYEEDKKRRNRDYEEDKRSRKRDYEDDKRSKNRNRR